jgi:hypothetical protein
MDLFNRKKVAALQSELALVTAQLKATTKQLDDLQTDIVKSYDELTEYFNPRYKNKYFKVELTPEQDEVSCAETVYMQVLNVVYQAGLVSFTINEGINNVEMSILDLSPTELKRLKVITKKEFLNKGGQE